MVPTEWSFRHACCGVQGSLQSHSRTCRLALCSASFKGACPARGRGSPACRARRRKRNHCAPLAPLPVHYLLPRKRRQDAHQAKSTVSCRSQRRRGIHDKRRPLCLLRRSAQSRSRCDAHSALQCRHTRVQMVSSCNGAGRPLHTATRHAALVSGAKGSGCDAATMPEQMLLGCNGLSCQRGCPAVP